MNAASRATIEGVLFDFGGVLAESPLEFIARFERERDLPPGLFARVTGGYTESGEGPWQRYERGEIEEAEFLAGLDARLAAEGARVSAADLMPGLCDRCARIRPPVLAAARVLRGAGLRVGVLSNMWRPTGALAGAFERVRADFDVVVESWRVRTRKPDPRIYEIACAKLGCDPAATVFLDDIGGNLKPARVMGMTTIKFVGVDAALRELERACRVTLRV